VNRPNWVRRQDEGDAQATSKPARATERLELRGQVVTLRTATGGLDKGCVRSPESDITNHRPCPRTGDLDGDGHQARRGGPQRSSGGGGCLGPAWPRVPGSVDDRGAETPTSPVAGDSPLALGDRAGSLPRRPCPGGRWGRRRGVCGVGNKRPRHASSIDGDGDGVWVHLSLSRQRYVVCGPATRVHALLVRGGGGRQVTGENWTATG